MSQKSKARAARQRENRKRESLLEEQKAAENLQRLKGMTAGFARTVRKQSHEAQFKAAKMPSYKVDTRKNVQHSTKDRFAGPSTNTSKPVLSPEMQKREDAALAQYHEMKKLVQPLYNKGGPQYPDASAIEAMKRGELRRRS